MSETHLHFVSLITKNEATTIVDDNEDCPCTCHDSLLRQGPNIDVSDGWQAKKPGPFSETYRK